MFLNTGTVLSMHGKMLKVHSKENIPILLVSHLRMNGNVVKSSKLIESIHTSEITSKQLNMNWIDITT